MKTGNIIVLIVALISLSKCDLIKDTSEIGVSIIRRMFADEREFGFNISVSVNAEAYLELIKFNASVTMKSIAFIREHKVESLKSFIDSFNKSVTSTISQLNSIYSSSNFHSGIQNIREKYGNSLLKDLNNRTEYYENFLHRTLAFNNCSIFKFIHRITDTISILAENIPLAVTVEAESYSAGFQIFKNILAKRGTDFENALTNCSNIRTTSVECCIDVYVSLIKLEIFEHVLESLFFNSLMIMKRIF